jgi:hypothetical protein
MFGGIFGNMGGGVYNQNYRAYPVAFIDKESAEKGDKVILPPSALHALGMKNFFCLMRGPSLPAR